MPAHTLNYYNSLLCVILNTLTLFMKIARYEAGVTTTNIISNLFQTIFSIIYYINARYICDYIKGLKRELKIRNRR